MRSSSFKLWRQDGRFSRKTTKKEGHTESGPDNQFLGQARQKVFDEGVDLLHQFDDCTDFLGNVEIFVLILLCLIEARDGGIEEIAIVFDVCDYIGGAKSKEIEVLPSLLKFRRPLDRDVAGRNSA